MRNRASSFRIVIGSFLVALSTCAWAEQYDVFLIAGQSNCDGRGAASELTGPLAKYAQPRSDVIIAYSCSTLRGARLDSGGFKPLQPGWSVAPGKNRPKAVPSNTFGPELAFGHTLADSMKGKHIALIKFAEGGTSLKKDWNVDVRDRLYEAMIAFVNQSLKDLTDHGHGVQLRGMIWHQGESDAGLPAEEYQELLTAFITRVRADLKTPQLRFGIGEVFDNGKRNAVRAAQKKVGATVAGAYFVPSTGLKTFDGGTHFDAASQIELGTRFATEMLKKL